MGNNINDKNCPNQMRILMKRVREGSFIKEQEMPSKDLSMRDMLKITRNINENNDIVSEGGENKETIYDQKIEEEKFRNFFNDMNVSIKFIELDVFSNLVFWGGTIDGVIQFVYKVTPDENTSGVEFNYLEDFSPDNPENEEITGRVESYFDNFYKYWRNNVLADAEPEEEQSKPNNEMNPESEIENGEEINNNEIPEQ